MSFIYLWRSQIRCGCCLCTMYSAQCVIGHIEQYVRLFRARIIRLDTAVNTLLAQYSSCPILEQQNNRMCVIKRHPAKTSGGGGVFPRILKPGS